MIVESEEVADETRDDGDYETDRIISMPCLDKFSAKLSLTL